MPLVQSNGLTEEQERKLSRIKLYATRHELVLSHADGRKYLLCYVVNSARRNTIFSIVSERAKDLIRVVGVENPIIHFAKRKADGATIGEWKVAFSGRTQRQAIIEGELTYIGKAGL